MKKISLVLSLLTFAVLIIYLLSPLRTQKLSPQPTTEIKFGEEGEQQDLRKEWIELMHRAAPEVNWRTVEHRNQMQKHQQRRENALFRSDCSIEVLADGHLSGQWRERGSVNQAGSVFDVAYDAENDEIWLISAGGTLWKADRFGIEWEVVNQDLRFNHGLLKFISTDTGRRLLAFIGNMPHYSDDDGLTWQVATGIPGNSGEVRFHKPVVLNDELNSFYVLSKTSYWEHFSLYKSVDGGSSFEQIANLETHEPNRLTLCKPHHANDLYLMKKIEESTQAAIFHVDFDVLTQIEGSDVELGEARANLIAWSSEEGTRFFTYTRIYNENWEIYEQPVFYTEDLTLGWEEKGKLPTNPWDVGMYVMPSNPDILLYGEVNCFKSIDGGDTWDKVNDWSDYYGNECCQLHADIMAISEHQTLDGTYFQFISHHGGLTYTENYLQDQNNISLYGLNVSQYYSVSTDPLNPDFVYAGSQDQGFQRSGDFGGDEIAVFDQVISGDYGHIVFSKAGQSLWMVYPGGWVTYYADPQQGGLTAYYDLISENESVWLPPLEPGVNPEEDVIYMAGGNIEGGPGSYIIRLEAVGEGINTSQFPFNFKEESGGGEVSAIEISTLNPNRWYAATTNGRVFFSEDSGETWEQALNFIPSGHYLYGQTIYASRFDEEVAYLGGSGYSNPPVYKTTDGGSFFYDISAGLPSTLVFDIAANTDESLLFAATEAGPYVYVAADERWYDLSGQCAPNQTYWSVEFIESRNVVRFGTYGRGIWDFELEEDVAVQEIIAREVNFAFPNPSNGLVHLNLKEDISPLRLSVYALNGQLVEQKLLQVNNESLDLSRLPTGTYLLKLDTGKSIYSQKLVIE